jgi:hypothetical protein
MFMRFALLLIVLPLQMLMGAITEESLVAESPAPVWVECCDFSINAETKPSQNNVQYLLVDLQENWEEKAQYLHIAAKVLSQSGIDEVAKLSIDFDPLFQKVMVHGIYVHRNGMSASRLKTARRDLLQREEALEANIYSGNLSLVYIIDDLREGDILEYAYSLVGVNPLFSSRFADDLDFQLEIPVDRIFYRLLTHPDQNIQLKYFNTKEEPKVSDLSPTVRELRWELYQAAPLVTEEFQPAWYDTHPWVQLSQYNSWDEVIALFKPLFTIPADFDENPSQGMLDLVASWPGTPEQKALQAVRFVQDEVRYMGFEQGINGFKPHDPRLVFQQRLGDCKDKTMLLHTLLRMIGIPSTPVFVHHVKGAVLPHLLPSPVVFDHVILRIDFEGKPVWVDPTINLQGGSLDHLFFPSYAAGLPINDAAEGLIELPAVTLEEPTLVDTTYTITSEDSAELKTVWTSHGFKADNLRRYVNMNGVVNITEDSLNALKKMFGGASSLATISVTDDRENNTLSLTEWYKIPTRKRGGKRILKAFSIVIQNFLDTYINPERTTPYLLVFPLWVKEHIHIENPYNQWADASDEIHVDLNAIKYDQSQKTVGHTADLYFELKHLKDHVSVEDVHEYWEAASDIEQNGIYEIKVVE